MAKKQLRDKQEVLTERETFLSTEQKNNAEVELKIAGLERTIAKKRETLTYAAPPHPLIIGRTPRRGRACTARTCACTCTCPRPCTAHDARATDPHSPAVALSAAPQVRYGEALGDG